MNSHLRNAIFWLILALLAYAIVVFWFGADEILQASALIDATTWIILLSFSLVNYLLRFVRWDRYIYNNSGVEIAKTDQLLIYVAGFAVTTTPAKIGEALRSFYLYNKGVSFTASISAFFVERLLDLLVIIALSILAAYYFENQLIRLAALCGAAGIVAILLMLQMSSLWDSMEALITRLPHMASTVFKHMRKLRDASAQLFTSRLLYPGLLAGLVAWGIEGVGLYLILQALEINCALPLAISIYAIAILAGALSFIPGGLGSTEAVMAMLLISIGADSATAIAATLISRVATLWFAIILGFIALPLLKQRGLTFNLNNNR